MLSEGLDWARAYFSNQTAFLPHQYVYVPFNGLVLTFAGQGKAFAPTLGVRDTSAPAFGVLNTLISAAAAAWLTTPIDVVKTRLQVRFLPSYLLAFLPS